MQFDHVVDLRKTPDFALPDGQALFVHIYPDALDFFLKRGPKIYRDVLGEATKQGFERFLLIGGDFSLDLIEERAEHFHIAQLDRPYEASNLVFIMPSYMHDFWYIDPRGVRNHSSIAALDFDPTTIRPRPARVFYLEQYRRFVLKNKSKWPQAPRGEEAVEAGSVALILQAEKAFPYDLRYVDTPDLIEATLATKGARKLYIKPHPKAPMEEQEALLRFHNPEAGVEVTVASIHQLLAKADYMVTQSSAVAFEANLHKTPAIVSGQVDFWHNAVVLKSAEGMGAAVEEALTRKFYYIPYVYWFLHNNLYETKTYARERIWARLGALGLPFAPEDINADPFKAV